MENFNDKSYLENKIQILEDKINTLNIIITTERKEHRDICKLYKKEIEILKKNEYLLNNNNYNQNIYYSPQSINI